MSDQAATQQDAAGDEAEIDKQQHKEGEHQEPEQTQEAPQSLRSQLVESIAERNRQIRQESGGLDPDGDPGAGDGRAESDDEQYVTIKVDGREQRVPLSQVIDSGKRAFQKESAGDERLRKAAEMQRQLQTREQELARREAEIRAMVQQAEAQYHGTSKPSAQAKADAPDFEAIARKLTTAIYEGDEDALVRNLTEVLAGRDDATPAPDVNQMVQQAAQYARDEAIQHMQAVEFERDKQKAIRKFRDEFPDLAKDERLYRMADEETLAVYGEHPDWNPEQIVTEAGKRVTQWIEQNSARSTVNERQERKRGMASPVRSASARATAPPAKGPKSASDVIKDMRRARGLPVN